MTARAVESHASPCPALNQAREHVAGLEERTAATTARVDSITVTLRTILQVAGAGLLAACTAVGILLYQILFRGTP